MIHWLRWSWRDLRERAVQVAVIALIIALGTGIYAGLGSTTPWRMKAADQGFEQLGMYDLQMKLTPGSYVEAQALLNIVHSIEDSWWIKAAEVRLLATTTISAGENILVRGHIIGMDMSGGSPQVNQIAIAQGRPLTEADDGQPVAILESQFAQHYHLPPQGEIRLSGDIPLQYVGQGTTPEYFIVMSDDGGIWAQASVAGLFLPLKTAQQITNHPNLVNNLVLRLQDDANEDLVRREIEVAFRAAFPNKGYVWTSRQWDYTYSTVYRSIDMNQQIYDMIAMLFLLGAAFGAFNLSGRIIQAQRREIGIGMALGMPPRLLMIRPLLVAAQIALSGTALGILLGLLLAQLAGTWIEGILPLPTYGTLIYPHVFVRAVILGLILPFVAALLPVWRAVRVSPIDAIKTGHLIEKGNRLSRWLNHFPLPGHSFVQIPLRNLFRSPRRTFATMLGIATAVTTLVGIVGILDSVLFTIDKIRAESLQDHPNRIVVSLDLPYAIDSPEVAFITQSPLVSLAEPWLRVPGKMRQDDKEILAAIELLHLDNPLWSPTLIAGQIPSSENPGILIAQKAADDLGVEVGDTITLEHPRRQGLLDAELVWSEVKITGIHADPWRNYVYMDLSQADLLNLTGLVNRIQIDPAPGVSYIEIKQALFQSPHVATVISIASAVDAAASIFDEAVKFLYSVEIGVLLLSFLIAFNSTNISMNERSREIATMFAFGLPIRTVIRMSMLENLVYGIIGSLLGSLLGLGVLYWFLSTQMTGIAADAHFSLAVAPFTWGLVVLTGVIVVMLTPLLTIQKMKRMDIPSTLRVME
ncbi:MAG TPA: FtsX-like permease family protein [Aggregatilineaceae bacterium]|nr:FtsX-like permease family protein [Aggregatilineaceae bacterium]